MRRSRATRSTSWSRGSDVRPRHRLQPAGRMAARAGAHLAQQPRRRPLHVHRRNDRAGSASSLVRADQSRSFGQLLGHRARWPSGRSRQCRRPRLQEKQRVVGLLHRRPAHTWQRRRPVRRILRAQLRVRILEYRHAELPGAREQSRRHRTPSQRRLQGDAAHPGAGRAQRPADRRLRLRDAARGMAGRQPRQARNARARQGSRAECRCWPSSRQPRSPAAARRAHRLRASEAGR